MTDVFIHIPKTGGTTIRNYLEGRYPDLVSTYDSTLHKRLKDMNPAQLKAFRNASVVAGHSSLFEFDKFVPEGSQYYTFLRHPVDRVISYYNHIMSRRDPEMPKVTLLKFLDAPNHELHNLQIQYLSGLGDQGNVVTPAHLRAAKQNIASGKINVGLLERLEDSLKRMPIFHGLTKDKLNLKLNESTFGFNRSSISQFEHSQIAYLNRLDIKLYNHVLKTYFS